MTTLSTTIHRMIDTALHAAARALPTTARDAVMRALRDAASAEHDEKILACIRHALAPHAANKPVGVLFHTMDFDNGNYLVEYGDVLFADGTVRDDIDFDGLDLLLTDEYGCVGEKFTLAVDLRTGQMDGDDYGDPDIHIRFGIPKPAEHDTEGAALTTHALTAKEDTRP